MKILVINPGSTSTKISIFEDETRLFEQSIFHDAPVLLSFPSVNDQVPFRKQVILDVLKAGNFTMDDIDICVGRGGSACPQPSGVTIIDKKLYDDTANGVGGSEHPARLGVMLAWELGNEFGKPMYTMDPTNVDELKEVLIAFRDQDANGNGDPSDEIPMSSMTSGLKAVMLNAFGLNTSSISNNSGTYLLDEKDGKVFLGETTDNYKAYLKYMNELWNENLLDHDNFIQTDAEFQAKASNAGVGVFASAAPFVAYGKSLDFDQNFCWFGGLSSDCQPERTAYLSSPVVCKPYYMINAESEHAPEIIRMLDYFYTKEGELVAKYGYEHDNYDMIALTIPGLEEFSILQIHQPEGYSSTEDYRNNAVTPSEYFGPYLPAAGTYHAPAMAANKEQLEALLPMYGWGILAARDCLSNEAIQKKDIFPVLLYNEAEGNERTSLYTDICLYIETMHAQFITGVVDIDAGWEDFQSKLEEMQLSRLLEIEQAAYNRLVANN